MNYFGCISPADYRYLDDEVAVILSEDAFTRYKLDVEIALVEAFQSEGHCSTAVLEEVIAACGQVTTEEVYKEERRIGHDIRALVNCVRAKVSDEAKPFVHKIATSYDIVDTANAARYKDVMGEVVVPVLKRLLAVLIEIADREAETVQIGRTHGKHAVPITFGFYAAGIANRLGNSIVLLEQLAQGLPGKFSGAVGAYNASSLVFGDPRGFERRVMERLGLSPAFISTQIAPPEPMIRLISELVVSAGIMANLARDMRHLQRSEIAEVGEEFGEDQVGSSTMPQKRNPINFENAESLWKELVGRLVTVYLDQVSEHQRDLTGSASGRTNAEIVNYVVVMAKRLTRTMKKLKIDSDGLNRNLWLTKGAILAEPLYILLAEYGHPDAHEKVRELTLVAERAQVPLWEAALGDAETLPYLEKMDELEQDLLRDPTRYIGAAVKCTREVVQQWKGYLPRESK